MADDRKLEEDQLVARLVPDPSQGPPNATPLHGYLGRAPAPTDKAKEALWRLYTSHALDEYVEIPESEILHTQKLPDEQGTRVWVPKTLQLKYVRVQSIQVQAELLGSGSIAQTRLPAGAATPSIGAGTLEPSIATVCSQTTCPPSVRVCLSHIPCPSVPCPSITGPCLSSTPSHCTLCPTPSATASHCTLCPTPSATPSHCICPITAISLCLLCEPPPSTHAHCIHPTVSVAVSQCTFCPTPQTAPQSQFSPCATPTVLPTHNPLCPIHPLSHLPECPVEGPGKVDPEE